MAEAAREQREATRGLNEVKLAEQERREDADEAILEGLAEAEAEREAEGKATEPIEPVEA
jgi:hypothetical protein